MTPIGAGRDISYVSNQMMEADTRAQKQLADVKEGLHGKIEDHLDAVTTALVELEKTVIGAIGVSQEERRKSLVNVSEQISKTAREQRDLAYTLGTQINNLQTIVLSGQERNNKLLDDTRRDFWKLFFVSLWGAIKRKF